MVAQSEIKILEKEEELNRKFDEFERINKVLQDEKASNREYTEKLMKKQTDLCIKIADLE